MKLLNKNNLAVRFAASKDESRYTLKAILVTEQETVATDGHMMARVSLPNVNPENFPTLALEGFKPNGFTRGLIPTDAAKEIEAAIPKMKSLPILNHAAISSEQIEDKTVLKVATTDLETPKVFTVREPAGQFPRWEQVWPSGEPKMDICVNAEFLRDAMAFVCKFSDSVTNAVRLRFYSQNGAFRFDAVNSDGQELNGVIMPLRATIEPKFQPTKPEPVEQLNPPTAEAA